MTNLAIDTLNETVTSATTQPELEPEPEPEPDFNAIDGMVVDDIKCEIVSIVKNEIFSF